MLFLSLYSQKEYKISDNIHLVSLQLSFSLETQQEFINQNRPVIMGQFPSVDALDEEQESNLVKFDVFMYIYQYHAGR